MAHPLCTYIRRRQVIRFVYDRQSREVEPHLLGEDQDGDLTLSAYQVKGKSGEGWRDFHVSKMRRIESTGQTFKAARPGYNRQDSTLENIICRLGRPPQSSPRGRGLGRGRNQPR